MSAVTVWHNPRCSTSRKALARLDAAGVTPEIYLYLKENPDAAAITALLAKLGLPASGLLRTKEALAGELGLRGSTDEDAIVAAMVAHPRLIERPVVIGPKGAAIARPLEALDAVLQA